MEKKLKNLRISSGLQISDISKATCITPRYLKAIEEGDFSQIPGDIYTRGYIKEYAKYLGAPYQEALTEYETYLRQKQKENIASQKQSPGKKSFLRLLSVSSFLNYKNELTTRQ